MTQNAADAELIASIQHRGTEVAALKEQRRGIGSQILAARDALSAKGIPKAAFDAALRYMNWDEDKRRGFDLAYGICRTALGAPIQGDILRWIDDQPNESASNVVPMTPQPATAGGKGKGGRGGKGGGKKDQPEAQPEAAEAAAPAPSAGLSAAEMFNSGKPDRVATALAHNVAY